MPRHARENPSTLSWVLGIGGVAVAGGLIYYFATRKSTPTAKLPPMLDMSGGAAPSLLDVSGGGRADTTSSGGAAMAPAVQVAPPPPADVIYMPTDFTSVAATAFEQAFTPQKNVTAGFNAAVSAATAAGAAQDVAVHTAWSVAVAFLMKIGYDADLARQMADKAQAEAGYGPSLRSVTMVQAQASR